MVYSRSIVCIDGCSGIKQEGQDICFDIPDFTGCLLQAAQSILDMILPKAQESVFTKA